MLFAPVPQPQFPLSQRTTPCELPAAHLLGTLASPPAFGSAVLQQPRTNVLGLGFGVRVRVMVVEAGGPINGDSLGNVQLGTPQSDLQTNCRAVP
jgi:hypothetical protein